MGPGAAEREEVTPAGPAPASRVAQEPRAQVLYRSELGQNRITGRFNETFRRLNIKNTIKANLEKNCIIPIACGPKRTNEQTPMKMDLPIGR